MICVLIRNLIDLYINKRLGPFQARLVREHLAVCPKCAAEAAAWNSMFRALRELPVPPPTPAALRAVIKAAAAAAVSDADIFPVELPEAPRQENIPSMVLAFSLMAFVISVSASVFGPGLPSQASTDDALSVRKLNPGKPPPAAKP